MTQPLQGGNDWKGHSPNCGSIVLTAEGTEETSLNKGYKNALRS